MTYFEAYITGERQPKKCKGRLPTERELEELLIHNPELLPHKNRVLWFHKTGNGPGDLVGVDKRGNIVIAEVKKAFGKAAVQKARRQARIKAREARRYDLEFIEQEFRKFKKCKRYRGRTANKNSFNEQYSSYFKKPLHLKPNRIHRYVIAESVTGSGERRIAGMEKRSKVKTTHVLIIVVERKKRSVVVFVSKVKG